MSTREFTVTGMTCGHCVQSVTEEVGEVPGVVDVRVVLETGSLTVTGDVEAAAVLAAVAEAGYRATEVAS